MADERPVSPIEFEESDEEENEVDEVPPRT